MALDIVVRGLSPLSRIWAAGLEADTAESLALLYPSLSRGATLDAAFRSLKRRSADYDVLEGRWRNAFFGAGDDLAKFHRDRGRAARRLMAARIGFAAVPGWWRAPPVRYEVPDAASVEASHGMRLDARHVPHDFAAPEMSQSLVQQDKRTYWLRFPSLLGDTAWARVTEPASQPCTAALVSLHGLAVEPEMLGGLPDSYAPLLNAGIRIIAPEAPFHGRRRLPGWSGGEPVVGRAPLGMLDLLRAWSAEAGHLIAWARGHGSQRVGLAGISMGALTAQWLVGSAGDWPAAQRPDTALLVTTSGDMLDVSLRGGLARGLGLDRALAEAGRTETALARWRSLLEPGDRPALPPEDILMVLGDADVVTPYDSGAALARRWQLPPGNVHIRPRGHFSQALAMFGEADLLRDLTRRLVT